MKETIDLYAKLVIGTFSFIGPSFTLLIPLFYQAIEKSREKHKIMIENIKAIIAENIKNSHGNFAKEILNSTKSFDKLIRKNERELNLLKPKRQVRRLFCSLFGALIGIFGYYFQHSHFCIFDSQNLRIICIAFSLICFVYCLYVLWQIFCTIIRIKSEEEKDKSRKRGTNVLRQFLPKTERGGDAK